MMKKKNKHKFIFLLSIILLLALLFSGCDSSDTVGDTSETEKYNALITIEGVVDEDHADFFSVSVEGDSGIDQFDYEENILTGSITDLTGPVELALIIDDDELDNGEYSVDDNTIEVNQNNNEANFIVKFGQEEKEDIIDSWTFEIEKVDFQEEKIEVEVENKIKLSIPTDNFNDDFRVTINKYNVKNLPEFEGLGDVQGAYSVYIDDVGVSSQSKTNIISSPLTIELYSSDNYNVDEILFMNYVNNQWRILDRTINFNRDSFSLETDNLRDLEKLTFSYINIQHGSITSLDFIETVTEDGNIKQKVYIEGIEGVIGNLGEAPWYRMSFYNENNVIDLKSPGDYLFNYFDFKYIPPGGSKDLEFEYYGVGGKVEMRLLSSGVEILPIFYADLLYMTLNNGDSLPFPINEDMLIDDDIEVAMDFLKYIEDEINDINLGFDSLHNNTRKLINWGKDKILEYAEDELTGELKSRVKNAMGFWWTLIHTANRSVSSVIFAVAGEDAQGIEFGSTIFPEIELEPANIELSPGDSQKFFARAYPRGNKDITLTGPEWNWYIGDAGDYDIIDENEIKINLDSDLEDDIYTIEVSIDTFIDGEIERLSEEAYIIINEEEVDEKATFVLIIQGGGFIAIQNDDEGESWIVSDDRAIEFEKGTELRLIANPDVGWKFSNWEGEVADSDSKDTTVTMDEDKSVIAHFFEDDNGDEIIDFDSTYYGMDSYFVFDYPSEWYVISEYEEKNEDWHFLGIGVSDEDGDEIFYDEDVNQLLLTNYFINRDLNYRKDKDDFYKEIDNFIKMVEEGHLDLEEITEILISEKIEFQGRPAYELKIKLEHPDLTRDFIEHRKLIFENSHEQLITYIAEEGKYCENIARSFFNSYEYMTEI